ncbi:MAG: metallophosphoesterase [Novosphingobium sp.]|nr:metallophosphoesterase [Novosphingobium sp.]
MLIAQITDVHIGFDRDNPEEANLSRFRALLARLAQGPNRPDMVLLTGDLTEHGDAPSYARLAGALADCPLPVWPIPGNHDTRAAFRAAFPHVPAREGFVQYALDAGSLRLLMLDTLEEGRHGGAFCDARAAWLADALAAEPDRPTLIVLHHPPIAAGIAWMDPDPDEPWIARFRAATQGAGRIVGVVCGHLHRPIVANWQGAPLVVAPSSAPALALNLCAIDADAPDDRALIRDEPPAFALHFWDGQSLVTHFESIGGFAAVARYDAKLQPMIRDMLDEPPGR